MTLHTCTHTMGGDLSLYQTLCFVLDEIILCAADQVYFWWFSSSCFLIFFFSPPSCRTASSWTSISWRVRSERWVLSVFSLLPLSIQVHVVWENSSSLKRTDPFAQWEHDYQNHSQHGHTKSCELSLLYGLQIHMHKNEFDIIQANTSCPSSSVAFKGLIA